MREPTPGPWDIMENPYGEVMIVREGYKGKWNQPYFVSKVSSSKDQEANAQLISAAPELLAACLYLCSEIYNGCNYNDEAFMQGVAKAEAIIAKAQGE